MFGVEVGKANKIAREIRASSHKGMGEHETHNKSVDEFDTVPVVSSLIVSRVGSVSFDSKRFNTNRNRSKTPNREELTPSPTHYTPDTTHLQGTTIHQTIYTLKQI